MKCGIITIHETLNYGSTLQTFGLYYGLKKLGVDAEVIDYQCDEIYRNEFQPFQKKSLIKKIILNTLYGRKYNYKRKCLKKFYSDNIVLSERYNHSTISKCRELYDKFIVGSDMVWNTKITGNDYAYFLDFVSDNEKKYAYSASLGDFAKDKLNSEVKELLRKFKYIAVREDTTADKLSEILSKEVVHVQDPTILIDQEILNKLALKPKQKNYVVIYYNDGEGKIFKDALNYAQKRKLNVYFINIGMKEKGIDNIYVPSIEIFLGLLKYADAIFTSSYHGMLISIYFNKEFWYYNTSQSARMSSVARSYEIYGRDAKDKFDEDSMIDYDRVNDLIEINREKFNNEIKRNLM